jgi:hypothetical protein
MKYSHQQLYTACEEAQQNGKVSITPNDLLVSHEGHKSCRSNCDILAAPKHNIYKTAHECRVQTILKEGNKKCFQVSNAFCNQATILSKCVLSVSYTSLGLIFIYLLDISIYCWKCNDIQDIVACLLKIKILKSAEPAVARERLRNSPLLAMSEE